MVVMAGLLVVRVEVGRDGNVAPGSHVGSEGVQLSLRHRMSDWPDWEVQWRVLGIDGLQHYRDGFGRVACLPPVAGLAIVPSRLSRSGVGGDLSRRSDH